MKPGRIALFFAAVIAALAIACALFPRDGITVAGHEFYLPGVPPSSTGEAQPAPLFTPTVAVEEPADHALAITPDQPDLPSSASDTLLLSLPLPDGISPADCYVTDTGGARFWLPDSTFFDSFWAAAEQARSHDRIVRIMHYGDSQIEMDRISCRLRTYMQRTFGGGGPGMLPFRTIIPTYAVRQYGSGALTHLSSFGDSTVTRSPGNYGPMMQCFRLSGSANVTLREASKKGVDDRVKRFSDISLVYNNRGATLSATLADRTNKRSLPQQADSTGIGRLRWHLDTTSAHLVVSVSGSAELYALTLDNGPGVAVDNIPMRGCSGQQFTLVPADRLAQAYAQFDVGLIILQFGGNSMPYLRDEKAIVKYCTSIGRQIDHVRRTCPKAKVLFIGPSDMSTRVRGQLQTYPQLPVVVDSLAATALRHGAAYWSIYHAMGGHNSMLQWKRDGLAGEDYVHFTTRGADLMGDRLSQALAESYRRYSLRRKLAFHEPSNN